MSLDGFVWLKLQVLPQEELAHVMEQQLEVLRGLQCSSFPAVSWRDGDVNSVNS